MALAFKHTPSPAPDFDLHETDFYAWLTHNAALIRAGRVGEVDLANVAEELEDMGRSDKRALGSHIGVLLLHLLKWQFQPAQRSNSWRGSINNARRAIAKLLKESPSLRGLIPVLVEDEYPDARDDAAMETGLPESTLPVACPYSIEAMLDKDFWPEPG